MNHRHPFGFQQLAREVLVRVDHGATWRAPPDQLRAYLSARTYVEKQMGPADLISILWFYRGSVRILQDFTDNKEQLLTKINVLIYGDDQNEDGISDNGFDGTAFDDDDSYAAYTSGGGTLARGAVSCVACAHPSARNAAAKPIPVFTSSM